MKGESKLGVTLGSLWGAILGAFGVTVGSLWAHFGVTLGSIWGHFGVPLVVTVVCLFGRSVVLLSAGPAVGCTHSKPSCGKGTAKHTLNDIQRHRIAKHVANAAI